LLATILLLLLIITALSGALYFSIAGVLVYTWNLIGFHWIRKEVIKTILEAREIYSQQPSPTKELFQAALDIVKNHWCTKRNHHYFRNRQQIRHLGLVLCFGISTIITLWGTISQKSVLMFISYIMGALTIIVGEVWIAYWRASRDKLLHPIREELRRTNINLESKGL
jgi:hypothetical protein